MFSKPKTSMAIDIPAVPVVPPHQGSGDPPEDELCPEYEAGASP